jgi:single-stranded DNA-binding protein
MNDLNSVLIEGTLTDDPTFAETDQNGATCRFTVVTTRTTRDGNTHQSHLTVETADHLARRCGEHLERNRGVRVVGCLVETDLTLVIQAEHVEFRASRKPLAAQPA